MKADLNAVIRARDGLDECEKGLYVRWLDCIVNGTSSPVWNTHAVESIAFADIGQIRESILRATGKWEGDQNDRKNI